MRKKFKKTLAEKFLLKALANGPTTWSGLVTLYAEAQSEKFYSTHTMSITDSPAFLIRCIEGVKEYPMNMHKLMARFMQRDGRLWSVVRPIVPPFSLFEKRKNQLEQKERSYEPYKSIEIVVAGNSFPLDQNFSPRAAPARRKVKR